MLSRKKFLNKIIRSCLPNLSEGLSRLSRVSLLSSNTNYYSTHIPRTTSFIFATLFTSLFAYSQASNTWTQKIDFGGTARYGAVGFTIGDKGYIGTGANDIFPYYTNDFWEYDPATNGWTQKANFGGEIRAFAVGFSIGNKGYIGTGQNGISPYTKKDFWEFDPVTNAWTQKAAFAGTAREFAVGFSIGNKGYLGTGQENNIGNSEKNDFWEYDPSTDAWTQKANFEGGARSRAVGFSTKGKGYITTGWNYDASSSIYYKDLWVYDALNDIWTQKADFGGEATTDAAAFSIGNKGYISTYKDFWEYDALDDTWTQRADFEGTGRSLSVGLSISGKGYIGTGYSYSGGSNYYKDFWEYTACNSGSTVYADADGDGYGDAADSLFVADCIAPSGYVYNSIDCNDEDASIHCVKNIWTKKADFGSSARYWATSFSIGNKGYLGTGYNSSAGYTKDFWEYKPDVDTWTQKADFGGTARYGAVGFSIGNKGYLGTGNYTKDFWEYDPDANNWTQKADFGGAGRSFAVSFSTGGKGYIGTGDDDPDDDPYGEGYSGDFWENDPVSNGWIQKAYYPGGLNLGVGFSIGSKGYVGIGVVWYDWFNGYSYSTGFSEYDPAADSWTWKAEFAGNERFLATGFSIGSKGFIGTGYGGSNNFWEYDQDSNTWAQKADFEGVERESAAGFSTGSKGYIGTGNSNGGSLKDFWEYTPEVIDTCNIPPLLSTINITPNTAKLQWDAVSGAIGYKVRYKIAGTPKWTIFKSADNDKTLSGLAATTEYAWEVKSICSNLPIVSSDWSEKKFFTTDDLRLATSAETMFELYPNPISQSATVSFSLKEGSPVEIEIMDVDGRPLSIIANENFSKGTHEITFNRESLIAGIYFLQLKTNDGVMMKKMVLE